MEYSSYYDKDCPVKMWDKRVQVNCEDITPKRSNMIENEVTFDGVRYYVEGRDYNHITGEVTLKLINPNKFYHNHIEKKPSTIMDKLKKIQSTPMYGLYKVVRR